MSQMGNLSFRKIGRLAKDTQELADVALEPRLSDVNLPP